MWRSVSDLLQVLEAELKFLDSGGYRNPDCWRPQFIFLDSPTCVNPAGSGGPESCKNCLLMPFVPLAMRRTPVPCHHIPLTTDGLTVDNLQRWGTQQELEDALRSWLARNIAQLKRALATRSEACSRMGHQGTVAQSTDSSQATNRGALAAI
jgi:hypothetical protein